MFYKNKVPIVPAIVTASTPLVSLSRPQIAYAFNSVNPLLRQTLNLRRLIFLFFLVLLKPSVVTLYLFLFT